MGTRGFLYLEVTYLGSIVDDVGPRRCKRVSPELKAEGTDVRRALRRPD